MFVVNRDADRVSAFVERNDILNKSLALEIDEMKDVIKSVQNLYFSSRLFKRIV
jgi:hypothetical protein